MTRSSSRDIPVSVASKLRSSGEYQLGYDPTASDQRGHRANNDIGSSAVHRDGSCALGIRANHADLAGDYANYRRSDQLPSAVETPLYFKAARITLQPGGKSSLSAANGILYQLSGSTEISLGGEDKVLGAGEALFVAAGAARHHRRNDRMMAVCCTA